MKIQPLQLNIQKSPNLSYQKQRNDSSSTVKYSADTYSYNISGMSFTGINKLTPKKMDIANEIKKLLKNINEILEFDTSNFTEEEILLSTIRKKLNLFRTMTIRKNHLLNKIIELENDTTMSNKEKNNITGTVQTRKQSY